MDRSIEISTTASVTLNTPLPVWSLDSLKAANPTQEPDEAEGMGDVNRIVLPWN